MSKIYKCDKCKKENLLPSDTVFLNIFDGLIPCDFVGLEKPDCEWDDRFYLCQECYKKLLIFLGRK